MDQRKRNDTRRGNERGEADVSRGSAPGIRKEMQMYWAERLCCSKVVVTMM
jgi:hypothetical protein